MLDIDIDNEKSFCKIAEAFLFLSISMFILLFDAFSVKW